MPAEPKAAAPAEEPHYGREGASPLDQRFSFDQFVVGKPNEFAYACARRVAERPSSPASIRSSSTAASAWARPI